uniref:Tetrahydrofolate dehydrogenase/cyclohydrolase NAD(P)-binding domain-containing protein n=1 Tax=Theropithecus gelada TaxID=9565 RepID=A0A8D2EL67_THEGE
LLAMSLVRAMATTSSCQCCSLRPHSFHVSAVQNEAVVISGRKLAQQIKQEVQQEVEEWVASGNKRPHLSMILVSENPASHSYVLNKTRASAEVGINGDATVTISHQYIPKEQPKKHTILADIVITATGIPNLTTADMIQEGAAVINLVGDVDFEGVRQKAGYITPVPGGIGPVTVAMLLKNATITAKKKVLRREEREVLKPKELGITTN